MSVAVELVDNIGELTGVGPITKLIKLIIKAASTARKQNLICRKFARWLEMIEGLLKPLLEVPNLMEQRETRKPLKELEESLHKAYQLVTKYKDRSYPYRFIMGSDIAERFSDAQKDIKDCIELIPLIKLFVDHTIICRVDTCSQDKEEEMDQDKEKGNGQNEEKEKGRGKEKDTEKGKQEKDEKKKKNALPLVQTVVLKVAMHCKCNGCRNLIDCSVRTYPGVETRVMEVDKGIASVTVAGHFDAKMLCGHVAKKTKKKVQLVGSGSEREDHQVLLEKTGSMTIGDGGKPPKGSGSSSKKRVVPITVVLMVGDTGLRCECNGCVDKIRYTLFKIGGVQKVVVDTDKNQVTVTGTNMDMENLLEKLGKKVKRPVEVVQPGTMDGRG